MKEWHFFKDQKPEFGVLYQVFLMSIERYIYAFYGQVERRGGHREVWLSQEGIFRYCKDIDLWREMDFVTLMGVDGKAYTCEGDLKHADRRGWLEEWHKS